MLPQHDKTGSEPAAAGRKAAVGPFSGDFLRSLPMRPGVYLMKNGQENILYVGKAKNLRKRVSSYQNAKRQSSAKTALLLSRVAAIETIVTRTEKEALILEASLIKKHRPRFNIDLKDDKSYPRIKVTVGEEWPRIVMTRKRSRDGSRYFGPYASAGAMRSTLGTISKLFPLRRCKGRQVRKRERPCLNYQMGRCMAPCSGKVSKKEYLRMVDNVLLVLEGRNRQLQGQLQKAMQKAAAEQQYEKAAQIRDQVQALAKTLEKQVVVSNLHRDRDVYGYVRRGTGVGISVMNVRQGLVLGQHVFFLLDPIGDDREVLGEVIRQYYGREETAPAELLLPFRVAGRESLEEWLGDLSDRVVRLRVPKRGEGLKLLDLAGENARQVHVDRENREKSWQELAANLQNRLHLQGFPDRVECLDISNIGGKEPVGSLVCFLGGEKAPGEYRHYSIRGAHEPDDYRMMAEVLERRFAAAGKTKTIPDLLIVDGGKGHLNIAEEVLQRAGLGDTVELVAIAKDKNGKKDSVYRPGRKNPLSLARHSPVLFFLMQVRDEAHRFGISFHRRMRRKKTLSSELDAVPGIGPARRKMLLKTLGSFARIKRAAEEELAAVPGIGDDLAAAIHRFFHGGPKG